MAMPLQNTAQLQNSLLKQRTVNGQIFFAGYPEHCLHGIMLLIRLKLSSLMGIQVCQSSKSSEGPVVWVVK